MVNAGDHHWQRGPKCWLKVVSLLATVYAVAAAEVLASSHPDTYTQASEADEPPSINAGESDQQSSATVASPLAASTRMEVPRGSVSTRVPVTNGLVWKRPPISMTLTPNGTLTATEGEGKELQCKIYHRPLSAHVQWYYIKRKPNGYGFTNYTLLANHYATINAAKYKTSYMEPSVYTLSIRHLDVGDDGQYTCFLYVGFSEAYRESVRIIVLPKTPPPVTTPRPTQVKITTAPTKITDSTVREADVYETISPTPSPPEQEVVTAQTNTEQSRGSVAVTAASNVTHSTQQPLSSSAARLKASSDNATKNETIAAEIRPAHVPSMPDSTAKSGGSPVAHIPADLETQSWSRTAPLQSKAPTRCEYQLIVNEIDANSCPTLFRGNGQASSDNYQADAAAPKQDYTGTGLLKEKIDKLEDRLIDEMVKHQVINRTVSLHQELLMHTERSVLDHARNMSKLDADLHRIEAIMDRQRASSRSLDEKVASVMLNLAELSARLDKAMKKMPTAKPEDKKVEVLSAAEAIGCETSKRVSYYRDCEDAFQQGNKVSDVYYVKFIYSVCPIPVWCDMDTMPGGWLVIQRRRGDSQKFDLMWNDYRRGFGNVSHDFWLGNDNLFLLTNQAEYILRVDLWDFFGSRVYAEYRRFKVDGERDSYRLHIGNYTGTAKDSFQKHDGIRFSTPDRDNDQWHDYHCALEWEAGWWFTNCWHAFLNGRYSNETHPKFKGMAWMDWKDEQLLQTEMKVRPIHPAAPSQG